MLYSLSGLVLELFALLRMGYEPLSSVLAVQPVVHSLQALLTAGVAERFSALTSAINPLSISIVLSFVCVVLICLTVVLGPTAQYGISISGGF